MATLDSPLGPVVGDRAAKLLAKSLDMSTVGDLLRHYPRRYAERGQLTDLSSLELDEHVTVMARVVSAKTIKYGKPGSRRDQSRTEVVVTDGKGELLLTFFRMPYKHRQLSEGRVGLFSGKVGVFRNRRQLIHPDCKLFSGSVEDVDALSEFTVPALIPVYPATSAVSSWKIASCVEMALAALDRPEDPIPASVRTQHHLIDLGSALRLVHVPEEDDDWRTAQRRLRFEEAFTVQVVLAQRRVATASLPAVARKGRADGLLDRFDDQLPFPLTAGQVEVSEEILADLARSSPMHRLLQGEVGSGKTVVALRAMMRVIDSGAQAVLLAPTEVLAQQHHRSITALLGPMAEGGMLGGAEDGTRVALLTGSLGASARRQALLEAASGGAGITVGTHALLEERVQFADLGLVVVDEQHRFGVEQRAALTAKSGEAPPHVLVMTATPIPRTVAMTVFGDLDVSTLRELPGGRSPIQSSVVPALERPSWLERAWERVREEAGRGHQTYVVCPRIGLDDDESTERDGLEPVPDTGRGQTHTVVETAEQLATGPLRGLRVAMLHGRMSAEAKDATMRGFAAGEIDVLVSTTVIEVGVDVANATLMVILDAERFGVSQLHQLRGRVGRGKAAGLCLLVSDSSTASPQRERLEAIAATTDGFVLSRLDLEQRRRLLSVLRHEWVIVDARDAAERLVAPDPELSRHPELARAVAALLQTDQAGYLDKA
jgi:ATP-dependent DNA helicase RecG